MRALIRRAGMTLAIAVAVAVPAVSRAATELETRPALKVCADPGNFPFSNQKGEGFENKIAELIGKELGIPVEYTWFPQATGFLRNTLRARKCDVVMGVAVGQELVTPTDPYYHSTYVLVTRPDSNVTTLQDPSLASAKIGAVAGTPPVYELMQHGLLKNLHPYQLMVDTRFDSVGKQMAADVASGKIDVGLLWGPIGGYFAKQQNPVLRVVPITKGPGHVPYIYDIALGVRSGEPKWKEQLNEILRKDRDQINAILEEYGVPLLDDKGEPLAAVQQ